MWENNLFSKIRKIKVNRILRSLMSVIIIINFSVKALSLFVNRELIPKGSVNGGIKEGNASFGVLTLLLIRESVWKRSAMTGVSEESHRSTLPIRYQRKQSRKNYPECHRGGIHYIQISHIIEHQRIHTLTVQRHSMSYRWEILQMEVSLPCYTLTKSSQ